MKIMIALTIALLGMSLQARAVDYELPDLDGKPQALDQYLGKWVVVNYWATWCNTCIKELPDLIALHEGNKDGEIVVVVGINYEMINLDRLKNFVAQYSIPYLVLRSEPVSTTPLGPVPALPTTYIINPEGITVAGEIGIVTRQNLEDYINERKAAYERTKITRQPEAEIQG